MKFSRYRNDKFIFAFLKFKSQKIIDNVNLNLFRNNKLNLNLIEINILEFSKIENLSLLITSNNLDYLEIENQNLNSTKNNNAIELKTIFKRAILSIKKKRKYYKAHAFFEKLTQLNFFKFFKKLFSKLFFKTRKYR